MSFLEIEFIRINEGLENENEVILEKEETINKIRKPETDDLEVDDGNSKCGEIYALPSGNFILICGFCYARFEDMRLFGRHMFKDHDDCLFLCDMRSEDSINPIETSLAEIKTEESLDCSEESVEFFNMDSEESRKEDFEESEESYKIGSDLDSECSVDEIRPTSVGDSVISCDTCHRPYKTKKTLRRHQKQSGCKQAVVIKTKPTGDPNLFCKICNRQLKTKKIFWQHKDRFHKKKPGNSLDGNDEAEDPSLFCEICNRHFKTKYNFRYHAERHDTIPLALQQDPDYLKCKYCGKVCSTNVERDEHENTHTGIRPFLCPLCQRGFKSHNTRHTHMRIHTRSFQCSYCPRVFSHNFQLSHHIKRHFNIRDFPCEVCGKRFVRKIELSDHMVQHRSERPFSCEYCGVNFKRMNQLREHRKIHSDTKNFKCETCEKSFYTRNKLKDHQVVHSKTKPHACEVCGRRFPRRRGLRSHMKLHSDSKEYLCDICGNEYAQDSGLHAHKERAHGILW